MLIYNILIIIVICLISWQLYLEISKSYLIEGMDTDTSTATYQDYGSSDNTGQDALILAQQNAGNITYLKQQLDAMQEQLNELAQQQADYATMIVGGNTEPIPVTGADYTSTSTTTSTTTPITTPTTTPTTTTTTPTTSTTTSTTTPTTTSTSATS